MRHLQAIPRRAQPRTNNIDLLNKYEQKGVYFHHKDTIILDHPKGLDSLSTLKGMDADSFEFNPASEGLPFQFLTEYNKKPIKQILKKRAYTEIGKAFQAGTFSTNHVSFPVEGLVGEVTAYDDYSTSGTSDVNMTFPIRDVYRGENVIQYGDLEVEAMGSAKIDIIGSKRYSAAQAIAVAQNKLFFLGNVNTVGKFVSKTYGIINNPDNVNAVVAPNGNWQNGDAMKIYNDVLFAFSKLQEQMTSNVEQTAHLQLCMTGQAMTYINSSFIAGVSTVAKMLKDTFPNMEFVAAPEYEVLTSSLNVAEALGGFQLICQDALDEGVAADLFSYKYRGHGTVRQASSYIEKVSFGSGGCAVLLPAAIVTVTGI